MTRRATRIRRAQKFFLKHAGYSTPATAGPFEQQRERELAALALARAEQWRRDNEDTLYVLWVPDDEPYQLGYAETEMPKEVFGCVLVRFPEEYVHDRDTSEALDMKHGEVLASLWSIGDPSKEMCRLVAAELALEVMP